MHFLILLLLIVLLVYGPQWWVRRVLETYDRETQPFPGDAGTLARHLLDRFGLVSVKVEPSSEGDHYDPQDKAVRLTEGNLHGFTLTAITTAAHEVGHAIQDVSDHPLFRLRTRLVQVARFSEKLGSFLLFAVPLLSGVTRTPAAGLLTLVAALSTLGVGILVQLATLPVEWDASFRKALPILEEGGYLEPDQLPAARRILRACALTYLAASLAGLLNFWRWMRLFRH